MFDAIWSRFVEGPSTLGPTPGVREAWHRGRARYAVWLLRAVDPAILARLDMVRDALAPFGVEAIAEPHVTVFVAGFPAARPLEDDDIAEATLAAQAEALGAELPSPRLAIGGASAFLSCPILEVQDPHGNLEAIRARLGALRREVRFAPYVPHLTIGTFVDSRPTGPIAAVLEGLRALPPLALRAEALELVTFDATRAGAALTTETRIVFASP